MASRVASAPGGGGERAQSHTVEGTPVLPREVIRATPEHFETCRAALGRAFENYPLMCYAAPEPGRRLSAVTSLYGSILWDSLRWGEVYTTSDFAGVSCWLPPGRATPGLVRLIRCGMLRLPLVFGWTGFQRLRAYDMVAQSLHHTYATENHWYLWVIGVQPEDQGTGIGGRLMAPIFARADAESTPCYLETHVESNVAIYESKGFKVACKAEVPGHPLPIWAMLRKG